MSLPDLFSNLNPDAPPVPPVPPEPAPKSGEQLRDEVLERLEAHRPCLVLLARRALLETLLESGEATADDIRAKVETPEGVDPRVFGSVPTPLAKAKIITRSGYTKTKRPNNHARTIMVWQLIDRSAALAWLAENPLPAEGGAA
jgi:hypothetical protein